MNCTEVNKLINAYLDKQLDAANSMKVEQHINTCASCNTTYLELVELSNTLQGNIQYYSVPDKIKQNILASLDNEISPRTSTRKVKLYKRAFSFAASLAIGFAIVFTFVHKNNDEQLIEEVLSEHIRAITAKRYADINSSKTETIIPWFTSRLNFSPRVFDFNKQGYTLTGGRLDSFQEQNIATVTYKVNHKLINVYTWPSPEVDDAEQELHHKQGYHLLYWCQNKMNYWIVSDSSNEEVVKLANLIHKQLKITE